MKTFSDYNIDIGTKSGTDCAEWNGSFFSTGMKYGRIWANGKDWLAHRHAWTLANGEIPTGMCILHRCDNPKCVNVDHLFLGTRADNMADKVAKGRQAKGDAISRNLPPAKRGEQSPCAKLTVEKASEIRKIALGRMRPGNRYDRKQLAKSFGISESLVKQVVSQGRWA